MRGVLGIDEEGQLAGLRLLDAGEAVDLDLAVTLEAALEPRRDVPQFHSGEYTQVTAYFTQGFAHTL